MTGKVSHLYALLKQFEYAMYVDNLVYMCNFSSLCMHVYIYMSASCRSPMMQMLCKVGLRNPLKVA